MTFNALNNLFNDLQRTEFRSRYYAEPIFEYLEKSANQELSDARSTLENWFYTYPVSEQQKFLKRFQSRMDNEHLSAFFELFLFQLLQKQGLKSEIELPLPWKSDKVIDFTISDQISNSYMEATVLNEETGESLYIDNLYHLINKKLNSPDYFLIIKSADGIETPLSIKKICLFLREKLAATNYKEILTLCESAKFESLPQWKFSHESKYIMFTPLAKSASERGNVNIRPTAKLAPRSLPSKNDKIMSKLIDKGSRYGNPTAPYTIALNIIDPTYQMHDIQLILFGISPNKDGQVKSTQDSGFFTSPDGPRNMQVSAILFFHQLLPWQIENSNGYLIHNPWAKFSIPTSWLELPGISMGISGQGAPCPYNNTYISNLNVGIRRALSVFVATK